MSAQSEQDRVVGFVGAVAERCREEPHLGDYLLWNAATLEHWLQILISSVGQEIGWAARTAIPYITDRPAPLDAPAQPSNESWADGAVVWPDGLAALIEVRTIPMRAVLRKSIEQVPTDLAALLAADWDATRCRARDLQTDPHWWKERDRIRSPWALQLALVHGGREVMQSSSPAVRAGIKQGLAGLDDACGIARPPWLRQLHACFERPLFSAPLDAADGAGVLLAWASPLAVRS